MPFPMVVCIICDQNVSKRSTLSLEVLGGGGGRACRRHTEVVELVEKHAKEEKIKKEILAINESFTALMGVSFIRVMYTLGVPLFIAYAALRVRRVPANIIQKTMEEVDRLGAKMSEGEITSSLLASGNLKKRVETGNSL